MSGYDARGGKFDIIAVRGADLAFTVTATSGGVAVDLSSATIAGELYASDGSVADTFTDAVSGAGSNIITLSFTDAETALLTGSSYPWTLWVTRGGDKRPWLAGRVRVVDSSNGVRSTDGDAVTLTVDSDVNVSIDVLAVGASSAAPGVQLPAANGTDDTSDIQQVLTTSAGETIYGIPGSAYKISDTLVISSDTTLDMTGCTVTLLAGSDCQMLINEAYDNDTGRDSNIAVRGGTWNRGVNEGVGGNSLHSIMFAYVDDVRVLDLAVTSTGGKYAVVFADCTRFRAEHLNFNTNSDGVHVTGPSSQGIINDITGTTGDDATALTCNDYAAYAITSGGGDISDVTISNVHVDSVGNSVKVLAGVGRVCENINIENVSGTPDDSVIFIGDDTGEASTTGGTVRSVFVRGVSGQVPLGYALVWIDGGRVDNIDISGLSLVQSGVIGSGVRVVGDDVGTLTIRGLSVIGDALEHNAIRVDTGASVERLIVSDAKVEYPNSTAGRLALISGGVDEFKVSGLSSTGGNVLVLVNGSTVPVMQFDNVYSSGASAFLGHQSAANVTAYASNFVASGFTPFVLSSTGGLSLFVGSGDATTWVFRSSTQSVRVSGAQVRMDVGMLTPTVGDVVYNTDATEDIGSGLVSYSDGGGWSRIAPRSSYRLSGSATSFISVPSAADLQLPSTMTFDLLFKPTAAMIAGSNQYLIAKAEGAGQRSYDCYLVAGSLTFRIFADGTNVAATLLRTGVGAALSSSVHQTLRVVVNPNDGANSTMDVYVNGVQVVGQVTGTAVPTPFVGTETLKFGGRSTGTNSGCDIQMVKILNSSSTVIGKWNADSRAERFHDGTRLWSATGTTDGWVTAA